MNLVIGSILSGAGVLVVVAQVAASEPKSSLTVFGVAISEPLTISECPIDQAGHYSLIMTRHRSVCALRKNAIVKAWGSRDIDIVFPENTAPNYLRLGKFSVSVLDGTVEAVAFATNGLPSQASALAALERKFGKPTRLHREAVENAFGARFSRLEAIWRRADLWVQFNGATYTDWGEVEIATSRYQAAVRAWSAERKAVAPKM